MHGFAITNATTQELCECAGQINGLLAAGALKVGWFTRLGLPVKASD
jgi:hypothetical protein